MRIAMGFGAFCMILTAVLALLKDDYLLAGYFCGLAAAFGWFWRGMK